MSIDFTPWTSATADLTATKQRVLLDTLHLVSEGSIQVVWGQDDYNGSPCLINAVGCMVKSAQESPTQNERAVVNAFDQMCRLMDDEALTDEDKGRSYLTPIMAEFLIRNFAPLKDLPSHLLDVQGQDFSVLPDDAFLSLTTPVEVENVESRIHSEPSSGTAL